MSDPRWIPLESNPEVCSRATRKGLARVNGLINRGCAGV